MLISENRFVQAIVLLLQEAKKAKKGVSLEVEAAVVPFVLAGEVPEKSKKAETVRIDLKTESVPVRLKKYPIKLDAKMRLVPLIQKFLEHGLLRECKSKYNTSNSAY